MKKILVTLSFASVILIAACGGSDSNKATDTDTSNSVNSSAVTHNPNAAMDTPATNTGNEPSGGGGNSAAVQLMAKSDCATCHKEEVKIVGPAFVEVANKYPNNEENVEKLAKKILEGGSGNWGDVPMPPHPSLSPADAQEMAKYVLSLKK